MRPRSRPVVVVLLVAALAVPLGVAPAAIAGHRSHGRPEAAAKVQPRRGVGDFNGDGFADLAVGEPGATVKGVATAGAVYVLYGTVDGIKAAGNERFTEATPGIGGDPESADYFGASLAAGDFDADGFSDLAIGEPLQDGVTSDEGVVDVLYGSGSGLTGTGSQTFAEGDFAGVGGAEHQLGAALAPGDFDGDGVDDLAIGIPYETVDAQTYAGAIGVLFGTDPDGLVATGSQVITQADLPGSDAHASAGFGYALTAADFGAGPEDDLAVGASGDLDGAVHAGSVSIIYADSNGLNHNTAATFHASDVPGSHSTNNTKFGIALTWGQLLGDGHADVVVSAFGEGEGGFGAVGAVYLLVGRSGGVSATGARRITESTPGVPSNVGKDEFFGIGIAVGNFGGTPADDLAISASGEKVGTHPGAGAVFVLPGSGSGPDASSTTMLTLNTPGIPGVVADNSLFGTELFAANFGNGTRSDLAVASKFEAVGSKTLAGVVRILNGAPGGLTGSGATRWSPSTTGIAGNSVPSGHFGDALA